MTPEPEPEAELDAAEEKALAAWVETVLFLVPENHHVCAGRCAAGKEKEAKARLKPWAVSFGPTVAGGKGRQAEDQVVRMILVAHGARKTSLPALEPPDERGAQVVFIAHGLAH